MNNIRAGAMPEVKLKTRVSDFLYKLFQLSAQTTTDANIRLMVGELVDDLFTRFPYLDLCEVEYACKCGLRGEYGEYFGVTIVSINKWIRAYNTSEARKEYIKNTPSNLLEEKTELTDEEKFNIVRDACIKAFHDYKTFQTIRDWGAAKYHFLCRCGLIKLTEEEKRNVTEQAKIEMQDDVASKNLISSPKLFRDWEREYEVNLLSKCRLMTLRDYFRQLIVDDIEIETLIPNWT